MRQQHYAAILERFSVIISVSGVYVKLQLKINSLAHVEKVDIMKGNHRQTSGCMYTF